MILNVLGRNIKVKYKKIPNTDDSSFIYGQYNGDTAEIIIQTGLNANERQQVLLHELIHSIFHRIHADADVDDAYLHILIDTISTVITENFKLIKR